MPTNNVVTITATSQVQSTLTATQNLTIVQPTAIAAVYLGEDDPSGNPATTVVFWGMILACTATDFHRSDPSLVIWTVANTNHPGVTLNIGSVSAQGIYTAPLVPPPGQSVKITATSQALATQTMSVTAKVVFGNAVLSGALRVFSTSGQNSDKLILGSGGQLLGRRWSHPQWAWTRIRADLPISSQTLRSLFAGSSATGPDGRGTMQFCEGTPAPRPARPDRSSATAFFSIVVVSPQQAPDHRIQFFRGKDRQRLPQAAK